jgi:Metallopeptidase family M24
MCCADMAAARMPFHLHSCMWRGSRALKNMAAIHAGYNSDVTRCWPVSGSFSPQQRDIYEAVLEIGRWAPATCRDHSEATQPCAAAVPTDTPCPCRDCIRQIRPGTRVSELHSWSCSQVSSLHVTAADGVHSASLLLTLVTCVACFIA